MGRAYLSFCAHTIGERTSLQGCTDFVSPGVCFLGSVRKDPGLPVCIPEVTADCYEADTCILNCTGSTATLGLTGLDCTGSGYCATTAEECNTTVEEFN